MNNTNMIEKDDEPVAWQCKEDQEDEWSYCSKEMHNRIKGFLSKGEYSRYRYIRALVVQTESLRQQLAQQPSEEPVYVIESGSDEIVVTKERYDNWTSAKHIRPATPSVDVLDAKRYRWLKPQILGKEYRRLGVVYGDFMSGIDEAIDKAMNEAKPADKIIRSEQMCTDADLTEYQYREIYFDDKKDVK